MQTIQLLVLVTAIATLIAGLNVSQVVHAQSKGTCVVDTNTNVVNNQKNGNPHCFDPEQQPAGTPNPAGTVPTGPGSFGCAGTAACAAQPPGPHPQSLNPQGKVVGDPHEEPAEPGITPNAAGNVPGNPHVGTGGTR
jgi:hypothetical protein